MMESKKNCFAAFLSTLKAKIPVVKKCQKQSAEQPPKADKGQKEASTTEAGEEEEPLNYDDVLKCIGRYGTWQIRIFVLLALVAIFDGLIKNLFTFTAFTPNYRCNIPFCEHPGNTTYFTASKLLEAGAEVNFPIYVRSGIPDHLLGSGEACHYLGISDMPSNLIMEESAAIFSKESCDFYLSELKRNSSDLLLMGCSMEDINGRGRGLIFDSSVVTTSIVTSYNLTCQRKWIKDFIDVLFEVAVLFGCLAFGFVSDHLGRLKAILIGLCTASTCGIIGAFIKSNAAGFAFFHLCVGLGTSGLFSAAFLLMLEVSSKTLALSLFPAGTIVGALISGLMSYMVPVWSTLQLAAFVPGLVVAAFLAFFAAESPRWMIATGNCEKARSLVKTGAAVNSREIKLQTLHPDLGTKKGQKIDNIKGGGQKGQISSGEWMTTIRKVCNFEDKSTAFYRNWTLNLLFHWTVVGLCLNGQLIKASSSNPHANVSYEALSSLPGFLMALVLSRTWGCRPLLTFCHLLSAVMLIVQSLGLYFSEVEGLALFGHLTANISLCAALASLQLLTSVMASTATRGTLVGLCLAFFHIGTIAGYPLNLLAILAQWLPTTIMAFLAVVAAVTAHLFPETSGLHQPLPDKWDHIIDLNKVPRKSYLLCNCVCPQNLKEICTFT